MWYVFLTCKKVHLQWNSFLKLEPFWQSCSAKKKKDKNSQSVNPEIIIRQSGLVTGSPGQSVAASFFCSLIQIKQFKPTLCKLPDEGDTQWSCCIIRMPGWGGHMGHEVWLWIIVDLIWECLPLIPFYQSCSQENYWFKRGDLSRLYWTLLMLPFEIVPKYSGQLTVVSRRQ